MLIEQQDKRIWANKRIQVEHPQLTYTHGQLHSRWWRQESLPGHMCQRQNGGQVSSCTDMSWCTSLGPGTVHMWMQYVRKYTKVTYVCVCARLRVWTRAACDVKRPCPLRGMSNFFKCVIDLFIRKNMLSPLASYLADPTKTDTEPGEWTLKRSAFTVRHIKSSQIYSFM